MAKAKSKSGAKKKPAAKARKSDSKKSKKKSVAKPKPKPQRPAEPTPPNTDKLLKGEEQDGKIWCQGDETQLDPEDAICTVCEVFEECSDAIALSALPEPEPPEEDEDEDKPEPPPPKKGPRRARPGKESAPGANIPPPANGARVTLKIGRSDSPFPGRKFLLGQGQTLYDEDQIKALEANARYSVQRGKG